MHNKLKIAVSACLLGHRVRYDGNEKKHSLIMDVFMNQLSDEVELIPFCPEVAIGLSVPRAKIQVVRDKDKKNRIIGVENHTLDYTEALESYSESFLKEYPDIIHFIVKSKSPSCGFQSTPLFECLAEKQTCFQQIDLTSGLFVQNLLALKPELNIIEEIQLNDLDACLNFIRKMDLLKP